MATIPPNTTQPVENMHSPHATSIEYHSQPNANEELSKITWQQETRVNGRRRPVSEFLRLQERAALGNPSGDNNAMRTAGLVNSCDSNFHGFQENYQQQQQFDSDLWNSILNDRQIMRETTQSQPNVQDCIQTLSYMQEYQDAATVAANLPTEAALFANDGYGLFLRNINSVWFEGSASSGVQESAKLVQNSIPLLDSSSIGSSSVINSPIPQYQTVECVVEPTGDVAQVPITPIDSHLGVPKEMHHEIQSGETAADSDADADSGMCSKTAMIRKRAPYKRRGFMKRNREPDKTSSTVTPHAQAELRKTLRGISSNPFPTVIMVADLCKRLELSNKQVRNWFALHRHRDMYAIEVDGVKEWRFRDNMI
ncbi:hypothetical protein EV175_003408 [Coemansia sp. RSA 1933]|nr:hypothetical protein EV175_003408 [Coemansia sp. RSA 1933]